MVPTELMFENIPNEKMAVKDNIALLPQVKRDINLPTGQVKKETA